MNIIGLFTNICYTEILLYNIPWFRLLYSRMDVSSKHNFGFVMWEKILIDLSFIVFYHWMVTKLNMLCGLALNLEDK